MPRGARGAERVRNLEAGAPLSREKKLWAEARSSVLKSHRYMEMPELSRTMENWPGMVMAICEGLVTSHRAVVPVGEVALR